MQLSSRFILRQWVICSCILFLDLSIASSVPSKPSEVLKSFALEIVDRIIGDGHFHINKLSLIKLRQEIEKVDWSFDQTVELPEQYKNRRSATCFKGQYKVIVKSLPLDFKSQDLPILALHEALCAVGYRDDDYQISVALGAFSEVPASEKKYFIEWGVLFWIPENPVYNWKIELAGGVSSVGSGGDLTAAQIKLQLLIFAKKRSRITNVFALQILNTRFEPSVDGRTLDFEYHFKMVGEKGSSLIFFLPVQVWEQSPNQRTEILTKLHNIFNSFHSSKPYSQWEAQEEFEELYRCGQFAFNLPKKRSIEVLPKIPQIIVEFKEKFCQ